MKKKNIIITIEKEVLESSAASKKINRMKVAYTAVIAVRETLILEEIRDLAK